MSKKAIRGISLGLSSLGLLIGAFLAGAPNSSAQEPVSPQAQARIVKEVRHELTMLPYYSVFDDLEYSVSGSTVTLQGAVTDPVLKSSADKVVRGIEGVENVNNQIEVLPLSDSDKGIRLAAYRALYNSNSPLVRYGMGAVPSIHIIVENGNVTLKGMVDTETDKNVATLLTKQVPGSFSVTNDLQVQKR